MRPPLPASSTGWRGAGEDHHPGLGRRGHRAAHGNARTDGGARDIGERRRGGADRLARPGGAAVVRREEQPVAGAGAVQGVGGGPDHRAVAPATPRWGGRGGRGGQWWWSVPCWWWSRRGRQVRSPPRRSPVVVVGVTVVVGRAPAPGGRSAEARDAVEVADARRRGHRRPVAPPSVGHGNSAPADVVEVDRGVGGDPAGLVVGTGDVGGAGRCWPAGAPPATRLDPVVAETSATTPVAVDPMATQRPSVRQVTAVRSRMPGGVGTWVHTDPPSAVPMITA